MDVEWTKVALKELRKIPSTTRVRIIDKVKQFADDPVSQGNNVKPLKGHPESRLRIGDYRVLFTIRNGVVSILVVHTLSFTPSGTGAKPMTDPAPTGATETVTVPKARYDALLERLEDLEDLLALREAEGSERVPHAVVERLLVQGENPLRVWRELRGLTQAALSGKSGVRQGYISEIETGAKTGSVHALKALAEALAIDIDDLV